MVSGESKAFSQLCAWAAQQQTWILASGVRLIPNAMLDAKKAGVARPENIRLLAVPKIPVPEDPVLRALLERACLLSQNNAGLTLHYGIYLRLDQSIDRRLLVQQLARVAQYEQMRGIEGFFKQYLWEVENVGYPSAPMEQATRLAVEKVCGCQA
ncbi:MAG: hypothetical protein AB1705_23625 [Verrucomicrobiota bacterium]